jgi:hypothetical protein
MSCGPNPLRNLNVTTGYEALANAVGEQCAFQPTTLDEGRSAHNHSRANQAVDLAGRLPELLLRKAPPKAFHEIRRRLLPIENNATADPACLGVPSDCPCDAAQPS